MAEVVIFGIGQWAELAHFYLSHDSAHDVVAFTVNRSYRQGEQYKGLPVVPFEEIENDYPPSRYKMFIPISFKRMNHNRADKYYEAKRRGYELISYVSSKATTWPDFRCGDNCFILEDNTIQPYVDIGNDVVMWSGSHVGHHSKIKDHVTLSGHVVISGCCTIEEYCFLAPRSIVRDRMVIARETLVGMGVTILRNTKEFEVYNLPIAKPAKLRSDQLPKYIFE
jgi:sugar O-acyltransferase (sialic acid O-acetyltransferase NeuD family)